jgi:FkbM family methyltransferase
MNRARKILIRLLGEKRYLALLANTFQQFYRRGWLGNDYQDIYFLRKFVREGDYCIDIGAHLGYYTMELSRLVKQKGRVFAIEPMSKFNQTLHGLLDSKKISNVTLYQLALGGRGEWVEMGIPQVDNVKKYGYARVKESSEFLQFVESEKVRNESGDRLFESIGRLDFIKCDVEGLEVSVFSDLQGTVKKHLPVLLCELGDLKDRIRLYEMLLPYQYGVYMLEQGLLHPLDIYSGTRPVSHNHYFIPAARLSGWKNLIVGTHPSLPGKD